MIQTVRVKSTRYTDGKPQTERVNFEVVDEGGFELQAGVLTVKDPSFFNTIREGQTVQIEVNVIG